MPPQILLGYMDEEVAPPLDHLLQQAIESGRPVFVVERAPDVGKSLFERDITGYASKVGGAEIVREHTLAGWDVRTAEEEFQAICRDSNIDPNSAEGQKVRHQCNMRHARQREIHSGSSGGMSARLRAPMSRFREPIPELDDSINSLVDEIHGLEERHLYEEVPEVRQSLQERITTLRDRLDSMRDRDLAIKERNKQIIKANSELRSQNQDVSRRSLKDLEAYNSEDPDTRGVMPNTVLPSDRFAQSLWEELDNEHFVGTLTREVVRGAEPKTTVKHPSIHVYQLQQQGTNLSDVDYRDPVILVRAPEMGMQPNATSAYLNGITQAVVKSGLAKDGVDVGVYGAGGATDPDSRPGRRSPVTSSLYVGYEYDSKLRANVPVVKFVDLTTGVEKTVIRGEDPTVSPEDFFTKTDGLLKLIDTDLKEAGVDRSKMSLSISYFGGSTSKDAAYHLGLKGGVNMEDYHTLVAMNKLKQQGKLASGYMERIDCDPYPVHEQVIREVNQIREGEVTAEYYKQAIQWGLKGAPVSDIPPQADWADKSRGTFCIHPKLLTDPETSGNFYQYKPGKVLDPFFAEVATDFVTSLAAGKAFGPKDIDESEKPTVERMQKLAAAIKNGTVIEPATTQEQMIDTLVGQMGKLKAFQGPHESGLHVWARPGKMGDPKKPTACLPKLELTEANVDRGLYKSTNRKALEDNVSGFMKTYEQERELQHKERAKVKRMQQEYSF